MPNFLNKKWALGILLVTSLIVHFLFFGHPRQTVFDEVHFGKFISGYYTHEYYFDIHPPLGKLLIAGLGKLFHFSAEGGSASGGSFGEIGEKFPDKTYMALRFLPSLAGALLPLVIYLLALELGFSLIGAMAAGAIIIFENALLTQSHYILLDAFLLLFGFIALLFYFRYRNRKKWKNLIGAGIGAGLAISVKWTGLTFLALPIILELFDFIKSRKFPDLYKKIVTLALTPILLYTAIFAVHFSLLSKTGLGDAFMSQRFQSTLQGTSVPAQENPPGFLEKFIELNTEMYRSNQRLTADHPFSSKWYTWPFMTRPIFYWVDADARIYLLGNPVSWWLSTLAVIMAISLLIFDPKSIKKPAIILLLGYILNLLPFIGIHRVMFLYHYLTALIFALLILIHLIDQEPKRLRYFIPLIALVIVTFIFFAPLSYGLPLSENDYSLRVWMQSWR
ncbi:MAG: phospholipid carrier-dependent glycosyltransferase [Patescibacteria group bacterium]